MTGMNQSPTPSPSGNGPNQNNGNGADRVVGIQQDPLAGLATPNNDNRKNLDGGCFSGQNIQPDMMNGKTFRNWRFISAILKGGVYEKIEIAENCDGTNLQVEGCTLRNFIASGLNTIGVLRNTTIGEGTKLHNLDQRGKTIKGLSFELNGKVMTSAELLEHSKKSPEARAEVESLLIEIFEGTVWDKTTKMDPDLKALLGMVSKDVENVSMAGTVLTTRAVLQDVLKKYPLIEGDAHDLSQPITLAITDHPEIELRISPKRSFTDRVLRRQSEPEEFVFEIIDRREPPDHSPMQVVGHGKERRAKPLRVFGFGRGEDKSKPLNHADLFDLLAAIARYHDEVPSPGGGQTQAA